MIPRNRTEATVLQILTSLWARGDAQAQFTTALQAKFGWPHPPVLTPSGRAAIYHACRLFDLPVVYLPAYTCWVVLEAVQLSGKPIAFVDVEAGNLCMDLEHLYRTIKTPGIIIATHPFGYPERMQDILEIARQRGCVVVEDCAGGLGTMLNGHPLGIAGDAAIYSFERYKLLTLGMGGALLVKDSGLRDKAAKQIARMHCGKQQFPILKLAWNRLFTHPSIYGLLLRAHLALGGRPTEGMGKLSQALHHPYCRLMTDAQCRLGDTLVAGINALIQHRRMLVDRYNRGVDALPGVRRLHTSPGCQVSPIRYPIFVSPQAKMPLYRDMLKRGVDLGFSFSYTLAPGFPQAEAVAASVLNLPVHRGVDRAKAEYIVASLSQAWSRLEATR